MNISRILDTICQHTLEFRDWILTRTGTSTEHFTRFKRTETSTEMFHAFQTKFKDAQFCEVVLPIPWPPSNFVTRRPETVSLGTKQE
jgi:hypothetical protein